MSKIPPKLVLLGFKNAGKTTLGAALAARWGLPFADSDQILSKAHGGQSLKEIYQALGEKGFRKAEAEALAAWETDQAHILALGGGTVELGDLEALLGANSHFLFLDVCVNVLRKRFLAFGAGSALFEKYEEQEAFLDFYERRRKLYLSQAHEVLVLKEEGVKEVVEKLEKERSGICPEIFLESSFVL